MKIRFYITEMHYRGITNPVYNFTDYNKSFLLLRKNHTY